MKLFGYSLEESSLLLELREVTLAADPRLLREMAQFLLECAEGIEAKGNTWEHEHFNSRRDVAHSNTPQFIVFNAGAS